MDNNVVIINKSRIYMENISQKNKKIMKELSFIPNNRLQLNASLVCEVFVEYPEVQYQ